MLKKIIKGLAVGGAVLTIAASAAQAADTYEINIYGASAQFKFWTAAAPEFLINQGCASTDVYHVKDETKFGRDAGIAFCAGTDAIGGKTGSGLNNSGNSLIIRYTTNASYDGIRAIVSDSINQDAGYECADNERYLPDTEGAAFTPYGTTAGTSIETFSCQDVNVGASDVAASTFSQYSFGDKYGYLTTNDDDREFESEVIYPDYLDDPSVLNSVTAVQTVVVPFGFFANDGGYLDEEGTQQNDGPSVPFDNLSRLMAVSLFAGQVADWNEFDPTLDSQQVVLCLRHAGSGTAATLNAAVMRGEGAVVEDEASPEYDDDVADGYLPQIWFNKGSSDEMRCVGKRTGAIGYADADKCIDDCIDGKVNEETGVTTYKYGKVKAMTYQGVPANASTIKNGQYLFWSAQWLYVDADGPTLGYINNMIGYAADGANMPSSKAGYWAAQDDMKWTKATDFSFPVRSE